MPLDNQASRFWEAMNKDLAFIMQELEQELEKIETDFSGKAVEPDPDES